MRDQVEKAIDGLVNGRTVRTLEGDLRQAKSTATRLAKRIRKEGQS